MDYQRILLIGNTTKNAVIKKGKESGNRYADFTVAARNRKGESAYYPIRCFGKLAEGQGIGAIEMGTRIFVEGEPDIYTHTAEDGSKRVTFTVIANTFRILSSGRRAQDNKSAGKKDGSSEMSDEDLPL